MLLVDSAAGLVAVHGQAMAWVLFLPSAAALEARASEALLLRGLGVADADLAEAMGEVERLLEEM